MYYVRLKNDKHGRRWKVRQAISLRAAYDCIVHAMASGSIGNKDLLTDMSKTDRNTLVLADVVRVNSDNTEAQPYQTAY